MKRDLAIFLLFLLHAGLSDAQTFRGAINGTVKDPSGASVANARVEASEIATGANYDTVTTADGQFSIQDLPLGAYKITIT
ncbi:MAG: carboxypeptidase-like regulatory domain-containing protein, partial [Terriglobales bacterium]